MEGAARVRSAATRQSWRAGVWEPRNVPASRTGVKCGPLSPVYSARPAQRPPRDTCPWTPYPRPAGGAPAAFSRDPRPGYFPGATFAAREGGDSEKDTGVEGGGGFPEMGCDCRRQKTERVSKRGPLLRWGALGGPTAELETFLPRGSTTRGRVTPAP